MSKGVGEASSVRHRQIPNPKSQKQRTLERQDGSFEIPKGLVKQSKLEAVIAQLETNFEKPERRPSDDRWLYFSSRQTTE